MSNNKHLDVTLDVHDGVKFLKVDPVVWGKPTIHFHNEIEDGDTVWEFVQIFFHDDPSTLSETSLNGNHILVLNNGDHGDWQYTITARDGDGNEVQTASGAEDEEASAVDTSSVSRATEYPQGSNQPPKIDKQHSSSKPVIRN